MLCKQIDMNQEKIEQAFKKQIESKTTKFCYGLETSDKTTVAIQYHKQPLDEFPDLEYVEMVTDTIPLFREKK